MIKNKIEYVEVDLSDSRRPEATFKRRGRKSRTYRLNDSALAAIAKAADDWHLFYRIGVVDGGLGWEVRPCQEWDREKFVSVDSRNVASTREFQRKIINERRAIGL